MNYAPPFIRSPNFTNRDSKEICRIVTVLAAEANVVQKRVVIWKDRRTDMQRRPTTNLCRRRRRHNNMTDTACHTALHRSAVQYDYSAVHVPW